MINQSSDNQRRLIAVTFTMICLAGCGASVGGAAKTSRDGGGSGGATAGSGGTVGGGGGTATTGTGGSGGALAGTGGAGGVIADAGAGGNDAATEGGPVITGKTSLIWIWLSYNSAIASVVANAKSFTHVSPAIYQVNYAYTSGVTKLVNASGSYDGLTIDQMVSQIHGAGLKVVPLMYGGAGNSGSDQGIENIVADSPPGTQNNFITAMVGEAVDKKYDGYNLDWEVQDVKYSIYGTKLITFLAAFKAALNQHGMILTLDIAGWYIKQCQGSGDDGLVDTQAMGRAVDLVILEDYSGSLGNGQTTCPTKPITQTNCDGDFVTQATVMCNLPKDVVSIGLISKGTNAFAPSALAAVSHLGFSSVSVWPDDQPFLAADGMPVGDTWYSVLADFMSN